MHWQRPAASRAAAACHTQSVSASCAPAEIISQPRTSVAVAGCSLFSKRVPSTTGGWHNGGLKSLSLPAQGCWGWALGRQGPTIYPTMTRSAACPRSPHHRTSALPKLPPARSLARIPPHPPTARTAPSTTSSRYGRPFAGIFHSHGQPGWNHRQGFVMRPYIPRSPPILPPARSSSILYRARPSLPSLAVVGDTVSPAASSPQSCQTLTAGFAENRPAEI